MIPEAPADLLTGRLRLKRWFLRTLVVSLATCAAVAVIALLAGTFNQTTARILLTLGALAVHSGIAMACAESLERRLWPVLTQVGLTAFGVNFCVVMVCVWWPGGLDTYAARAVLGTGALAGFYVLAIPCAAVYARRYWWSISVVGLAVCTVGLAMTLVCIWAQTSGNIAFAKATGVVAVVAFSLAHVCTLVRVPGGPTLSWLLGGTIVCIGAVAGMWSAAIIYEPRADLFYRVFGALGVLDASGTLMLLIIAKLRQMGKLAGLQSTPASIEITCPRCTTSQTVDAGKSKCKACGLKFTIEIEEPRCAKCNYLLWKLPERRCPECGTVF